MVGSIAGTAFVLLMSTPIPVDKDHLLIALADYPSAAVAALPIEERQMFAALNVARRRARLPILVRDPLLDRVAREHARDMVQRRYFGHDTPDGTDPFERMREAGVSFGYAGENLAMNADAVAAEAAFMRSAEHRANILEPHYRRVGIATAGDPSQGEMFVQEFTD
jgi:uncharacterized protein YkwD